MKRLLPVEDVLEVVDSTAAALSSAAGDFARRLEDADEDLPCLYQWHKLEKAARDLLRARCIENESLAAVSVLAAQKELIRRAVALMDCVAVTGGQKDSAAPNLRQPGRRTRKHPWGPVGEEEEGL